MAALDEIRAKDLAKIADSASDEMWPHQIVVAIRNADSGADAALLASAFAYSTERGERSDGERFGHTLVATADGVEELTLANTPGETCAVWSAVAAHATHPRLLARLHDLLFERHWGNGGTHSREAIAAYISLGDAPVPSLEELDALQRAVSLIRVTKQVSLLPVAIEVIVEAATNSLDTSEHQPGVTLPLLELLINADADADGATVDALLLRARNRYPDAWNTAHTIKLQRHRAPDDAARELLNRDEVQARLDEADRADPLVRVVHLQQAATLAQQHGLRDLVDKAVLAMQSLKPSDLPLIRLSGESDIPAEVVEQHIEALLDAKSWFQAAMQIVLASGPPTGDVEQNRIAAEDNAAAFPLQALFPKVHLGGDSLPRYQATTEEEHADDRLTEHEAIAIQVSAAIRAEAFARAGAKFGVPTTDEIVAALAHMPLLDDATSHGIARVISRLYVEDFEACAYTALPLVERLARNLLLSIDAPIYRVQRQRAPGQYPGLGAMLADLHKRGLDPSWFRFLRTLLSSPNGLNFRNEVLHGFVIDVGPQMAVASLIALLYLAALG